MTKRKITKKRKYKLSDLERKCLTKYYFLKSHDLRSKELNDSTRHARSLGFEGCLEIVEKLAEESPRILKIVAHDIDNFSIFLDSKRNKKFKPIFVMKDGEEQEL